MCSVHYELQLLSLFHSRLYQPSSQYSCHAQKDTSTSGFPYPWLDIGLAAHESFEATPCSNLLSCMEGWIPHFPNYPINLLMSYSELPLILFWSIVGFPVSSTSLLPFVSLETHRIPASSIFISSRFSSLKLASPKFELSSFCRSVSVTEPFFPRNSTMPRDIGLGLHTFVNDGVRTRDYSEPSRLLRARLF